MSENENVEEYEPKPEGVLLTQEEWEVWIERQRNLQKMVDFHFGVVKK